MSEVAGKDGSGNSRKTSLPRPQEPPLKCPRCDSANTKFCYYNNYNLSQPRHFCKTCRRYWTKGGALRNVPIGGGCRKNKKMKTSSRLSGDLKDSNGGLSDIGSGLRIFQGFSPAMDFQIGGLNLPRINHSPNPLLLNQFSSFPTSGGEIAPNPCFSLDYPSGSSPLMGFNFPFSSATKQAEGSTDQQIGLFNVQNNLASSIESLSSINQNLHWKLQQERLMDIQNSTTSPSSAIPFLNQIQKSQPISFPGSDEASIQAAETSGIPGSRKEGSEPTIGSLSSEWFFDSTNEKGIGWNNLSQYSALP